MPLEERPSGVTGVLMGWQTRVLTHQGAATDRRRSLLSTIASLVLMGWQARVLAHQGQHRCWHRADGMANARAGWPGAATDRGRSLLSTIVSLASC